MGGAAISAHHINLLVISARAAALPRPPPHAPRPSTCPRAPAGDLRDVSGFIKIPPRGRGKERAGPSSRDSRRPRFSLRRRAASPRDKMAARTRSGHHSGVFTGPTPRFYNRSQRSSGQGPAQLQFPPHPVLRENGRTPKEVSQPRASITNTQTEQDCNPFQSPFTNNGHLRHGLHQPQHQAVRRRKEELLVLLAKVFALVPVLSTSTAGKSVKNNDGSWCPQSSLCLHSREWGGDKKPNPLISPLIKILQISRWPQSFLFHSVISEGEGSALQGRWASGQSATHQNQTLNAFHGSSFCFTLISSLSLTPNPIKIYV